MIMEEHRIPRSKDYVQRPNLQQSMFSGSSHVQVTNGTWNNTGRDQYHNIYNNTLYYLPPKNIQEILAGINYSYRHDSHARFPYPKCSEGTREEVLGELLDWARAKLPSKVSGVYWIRGAAGIGKSAIAQSVAERCEGNELLATFFFSRADPNRNNPRYLVLAIAYGISTTIPELRNSIHKVIQDRPDLLQASLEVQFRALVIEPLVNWRNHWQSQICNTSSISHIMTASSMLVVIDGLDECIETREQVRVLALVLLAMEQELPVRFLICSRPEPQIRERFNREDLRQFTKSLLLDNDLDVNRDIENMFRKELEKIRHSTRCSQMAFPNPWPAQGDLETLVEKSSGQFIYVTTVLKIVGAEDSNPHDQLQIILGLSSYESSLDDSPSPYFDLDILYQQILNSATKDHQKLVRVVASILLLRRVEAATPHIIEHLLGLRSGDVALTLRKMHSVLHIQEINDEILIHHASFIDFLSDQSRSGPFFIDMDFHHQDLVCCWLYSLNKLAVNRKTGGLDLTRSFWEGWGRFCSSLTQPNDNVFEALRAMNPTCVFIELLRQPDPYSATIGQLALSEFDRIRSWLRRILAPMDLLRQFDSIRLSVECPPPGPQEYSPYQSQWPDPHSADPFKMRDLAIIDPWNDDCVCHAFGSEPIVRCTEKPNIFHISFTNPDLKLSCTLILLCMLEDLGCSPDNLHDRASILAAS